MPKYDLKELGVTGLERWSGQVFEERLPELRGERGRRIYRQMAESDATVGALLFAIEMLCRQVTWEIQPATESAEDQEIADFFSGALFEDMSQTWPDLLSEILTCLIFGWSYFEIVYKTRQGESADPTRSSRFTDGRVGWRKWSPRAQETLNQWEFDDEGGIQGMTQSPPPDYVLRTIPIEKALLFRTATRKGNPEGFSILRRAYTSWYYKTNVQRIEGIGIERDLAGLPVAYVPPELLSTDASTTELAILSEIKKIVTGIRRDEQEGVIFPQAYDDNGKLQYDLKLLSSSGSRQFDTDKVVVRYDQRILMSVLADFLLLGHEKVGSFALSNNKTSLFSVALGAWLDSICEVVNRFAIPRLGKLNAMPLTAMPKLTHGDIEDISLTELADYVAKLSTAGISFNTPEVKTRLYEKANLPVPAEGFESVDDVSGDNANPTNKQAKPEDDTEVEEN